MRQGTAAKQKNETKKLFQRTAFSEFVEMYVMAMFAVVIIVHIL